MKLIKRTREDDGGGGGWWAEDGGRLARLEGFALAQWLGAADPAEALGRRLREARWQEGGPPASQPAECASPVEDQEVWAAGVTYLRSKAARMEESESSASAYDRVYDAARPELFFKATARRCVGSGGVMTLRSDSRWMVPEPELTLVISAGGQVVGYTLGNDLSCRDIEGENTLYLPQAKVWDGCCAVGPAILVAGEGVDVRSATISLEIRRDGQVAFAGSTPVARIKRSFEELVGYLFRHQRFDEGVFLLTGTGIVPPDDFSLRPGDEVAIELPEIGRLVNRMR